MSKHSIAPWIDDPMDRDPENKWINLKEIHGFTRIRALDGSIVAGDVDTSTAEGRANVILLVLSPRYLEALRLFVAFHAADHEKLTGQEVQAMYDKAIDAASALVDITDNRIALAARRIELNTQ